MTLGLVLVGSVSVWQGLHNSEQAYRLPPSLVKGLPQVQNLLLLDGTPLTMGLKIAGDVMKRLIERNDTFSTEKGQTFKMHTDNQPNVLIQVVKGERAKTENNDSLGEFQLDRIPRAPRGMPQVEVIFDIDAAQKPFCQWNWEAELCDRRDVEEPSASL